MLDQYLANFIVYFFVFQYMCNVSNLDGLVGHRGRPPVYPPPQGNNAAYPPRQNIPYPPQQQPPYPQQHRAPYPQQRGGPHGGNTTVVVQGQRGSDDGFATGMTWSYAVFQNFL